MPVELQIPDIVWQQYADYQDACAETLESECLWCNPHGRGVHQTCVYHEDESTLPGTHPQLWTPDDIKRIGKRAEEFKDLFDEIKIGGTD